MTEFNVRQDSSGRIQPTEGRYLWYPGYCCMCSKPPEKMEEPFANLQVDIELFGNLYLCLNCCAEVADFIGFKSPRLYNETIKALAEANVKVEELEDQLLEARGLLDARIRSAGRRGDPAKSLGNGTPSVDVSASKPKPDIVDSILNAN